MSKVTDGETRTILRKLALLILVSARGFVVRQLLAARYRFVGSRSGLPATSCAALCPRLHMGSQTASSWPRLARSSDLAGQAGVGKAIHALSRSAMAYAPVLPFPLVKGLAGRRRPLCGTLLIPSVWECLLCAALLDVTQHPRMQSFKMKVMYA